MNKQAILEANRKGHVCGTFARPCIHHGSMHCIAAGQRKAKAQS
jgi:hypothetical protein